MQRVVEQELGCIVWGGAVNLSPADDILIRVERVMDLDSEGQLIASVLSKKSSAGSTHIVIDIPVGPTAKIRTLEDLRERALTLAGKVLEFSPKVNAGEGKKIATQLLNDGTAWKKFQAICHAQGGLREPPVAAYTQSITSPYSGRVSNINNRQIARLAKLAGAPHDKAAGVVLHTPLESWVEKNQPLLTIHAESKGALRYALSLLEQIPAIVQVEGSE